MTGASSTSPVITNALASAKRGWPVFPVYGIKQRKCTCYNPACEHPGKHPRTKNGFFDASTDIDGITRWGPDSNYGIRMGAEAGVFAVDVDPRHSGDKTLADLEAFHGKLPATYTVTTGGEGQHIIFKHPGFKIISKTYFKGVDVKGDGGYIVGAGSLHISGRYYTILNDVPVSDAPKWFLDILRRESEGQPGREGGQTTSNDTDIIPEGQRNSTLTSLAGTMRKRGMAEDEFVAAIRVVNSKRCRPPLPDVEVDRIAKSVGRYAPGSQQKTPVSQESSAVEGHKSFDPATLPNGLTLQAMEVTVDWLIKGLLPRQAITVLHGRGGIGKTWLSLQMGESIAKNSPFLGLGTLQAPVYYIDFENPLPVLVERVKALNIQHVRFWHISNEMPPPPLDTLNSDYYGKLPEGSFIIFDTFRSAHTGDENDSKDISRVLTVLKQLREKGYTILLLHHTSKGNDSRYKGSTAILDLCDHELNLCDAERKEGEQDTYKKLFTPQKSRYQTEEVTLDFDLDEGGFLLIPDQTEETLKKIHESMSGLSEESRKKTSLIDHLKNTLTLSRNNIRRLLDRGIGKYWTTEAGDHNAIFYSPISVCQFAAPIYSWQTEKLNLPVTTSTGKLPPENNLQYIINTEFASLPEDIRQTEKLDLLEGEI